MKPRGKVSTEGGQDLGHNPFGALSGLNLPVGTAPGPVVSAPPVTGQDRPEPKRNRGRVEIRRQTGGRGGKTVTVASGFVGIGGPEKETLAKTMRQLCGCGGTVKDGNIEIQGDQREKVAQVLSAAGFKPVFAGG